MNPSRTRKIKKFEEMPNNSGYRRLMNQLVIRGLNKGFFGKSKPFEIQIYYTPMQKKIMDIIINGVEYKNGKNNTQISIPFKEGDNISTAKEWCEKNKYEIFLDIKKF